MEKAKASRSEYLKKYREDNKERINENRRIWAKNNKKKIDEYQQNYWGKRIASEN